MKKILWFLLGSFFFAGVALAAPYYTAQRSIIPVDSTENVGTSTSPWAEGWFGQVCIAADCRTSWPGGLSSYDAFTHPSYGGSATTSLMTLTGGILVTASSTFSNLGTGAVYTQNGLLLSHATTSASVAYQDVWRDGNGNAFANNFIPSLTSTVSSGGTVVLTPASTRYQLLTGSANHTFQMPNGNASGMTTGATWDFNNNSTGNLIVQTHGGASIVTIPPGGFERMILTDNGTSEGSWEHHAYLGHFSVSGNYNLGVGSSTPWGQLSVHDNPNSIFLYPFVIGSSTAAATTTLFSVSNTGVASTTGLVVSGNTTLNQGLTGLLTTSAGVVSNYAGTTCTNQAITVLSASGAATCSSITDSFFSGTLGIAHGGTNASSYTLSDGILAYNGTSFVDYTGYTLTSSKLTATNASSTALTGTTIYSTTLSAATTSPAFTLSVGNTGSDFYVTSTGKIVGRDTTLSLKGRITPLKALWFPWATTTTWTASTSGAYAAVDTVFAPWTGSVSFIRCMASTTQSFLGVQPYINHTTMTPSYLVASSTIGTTTMTANNTFNSGDVIGIYVGTTTSDANALAGGCWLYLTETP